MNLTKLALEIVQYNPFVLPANECNTPNSYTFKMRALFKLMLYSHIAISFPRHFDPDLGQYKLNKEGVESLPLEHEVQKILKYKTGNCGTYATLFEELAKSLGFEARHVGLRAKDGKSGHWCSEVKIEGNWTIFDPMYINCPLRNKKGIPGWKLVESPSIYINNLMGQFKGIERKTWLNLFKGLEINGVRSYGMKWNKFVKQFYGEEL